MPLSLPRPVPLALALLLAGLLALPAQAQQKLIADQSEISFVSKQMGVPVEGRFKKFEAQIVFDPAKLATSKIALTVDIASATLGAPEVDSELPKAPWFNTAKFPQATFQSSAIKSVGPGKFEVSGKLGIKGNTRDVVIPVSLAANGASTVASGTFPIKRLAFSVGDGDWADTSTVADDVQVKFKLALNGVGKF
ncbi:MAG: YceI family protein [Rhodoferax sp.]|nr:YceI family protein [Rhodoferax sp.]MCF8208578.1 YceI family protein [Rhodoferax sp.]